MRRARNRRPRQVNDLAIALGQSIAEQLHPDPGVRFSVPPEAYQSLVGFLEAPATPNPGLARLMATKAPWEA